MPDDLAQLRREIAALFAGPLDAFVGQRKKLQARAKEEFPDLAATVGALRKPTRTAWVVNRLLAEEPGVFDALVESGFRLRDAIAQGDPSQALQDRQAAISRALDAIETSWGEGTMAPAQRQRIANTLQALSVGIDEAVDPSDERASLVVAALRGRLTADLDPPGLEVLMGLVPGRNTRSSSKKRSADRQASGKGRKGSKGVSRTSAKGGRAEAAEERKRKARQRALRKKIDQSIARGTKIEGEMEAARAHVLELQDRLEEARTRRAELREQLDAEVARRRELESELRGL